MNKSIVAIWMIILIVTACVSPNNKEKLEPISEQILSDKLDEYFSALTKIKKFNGGVLIQKDEEIILRKAYNMNADQKSTLNINTNAQFDVHSISKLMAKACIVKLEEAKLISREDKVSDYISDFPKGESMNIQHLLDNQSGLPRDLTAKVDNLIKKKPAEVIELIKHEELIFTPGTDALYSNLGYQLVYFIISKITEKPFVQYLKDELFIPLEMNDSGAHFYLDKSNLTNPVTNHEEEDGEIISVANFKQSDKNQSKVYSTLDDLLKFINEVKKEPYLSKLINQSGNIGWSGGGDGILSHAEANLNSGYEVIFFSNYDEIPFGGILGDVDKIMTNKPYSLPKEINRNSIKLDRAIIARYVGKYDMAEFNHDEFEIRIENDSVAFYQNGEFGGMLYAENDTTFFGDPQDEDYFIFRKGQDDNYKLVFKYKGVDIVGEKK